jgi:uncharacterized protein
MMRQARLGSLRDAFGWLITDGKRGMEVQCQGVADALGVRYALKRVTPTGIHRLLSPWILPARSEWQPGGRGALAPPWPDIAIATGRLSIPYIRALGRVAGASTFRVVLQDPKTGTGTADIIWVPRHDKLRGANVITTITSPHVYSRERLSELRRLIPAEIEALPKPRVAVLLGGDGGGYRYTASDVGRLCRAIASVGALGVSYLVAPSRRTPQHLVQAVDEATRLSPRLIWTGAGENPYPQFLAHADRLIVTADSVNMTGEACATGRPVYVFEPSKGAPKFKRFHSSLQHHGATRPLPDRLVALDDWAYEPLFAAPDIAAAIEQRWRSWRSTPVPAAF